MKLEPFDSADRQRARAEAVRRAVLYIPKPQPPDAGVDLHWEFRRLVQQLSAIEDRDELVRVAALELIENATLLASVVHEVAVHTGDDPAELLDKLAAGDQGSAFL